MICTCITQKEEKECAGLPPVLKKPVLEKLEKTRKKTELIN
jgi:hypothetical protein